MGFTKINYMDSQKLIYTLRQGLLTIRDDFDSVENIRNGADDLGLSPDEAIEMSYENIKGVASRCIKDAENLENN